MAVLDRVFAALDDVPLQDEEQERVLIQQLKPGQRTFYLTLLFDGEVNNGGFAQYLYNPPGEYACETLDALLELGARKHAKLLEEAMAVFPAGPYPRNREARERILDNLPEDTHLHLESLATPYYEVDTLSSLRDRWKALVENCPADFFR